MCGSSLWFSKNCGWVPIPTAVLKLPSPPARIVVGGSNDPWEVWQLVAPIWAGGSTGTASWLVALHGIEWLCGAAVWICNVGL